MQLYGASGGDNSYYSDIRGDSLYYQARRILEALQRRNDTFYVVSFHKVSTTVRLYTDISNWLLWCHTVYT